jgi:hypothetical protein
MVTLTEIRVGFGLELHLRNCVYGVVEGQLEG